MHFVNRLDVFPKYDTAFEDEARDRTLLGASLSVGSFFLITILTFYELQYFNERIIAHRLDVATSGQHMPMPVFVNISFPSVTCAHMGLDAVDAVGDPVLEGSHVVMTDLEGGGCNAVGQFNVNNVQGNIHVAPGKAEIIDGNHVREISRNDMASFNVSHIIHSVSFGPIYPGQINPLDNYVAMHTGDITATSTLMNLLYGVSTGAGGMHQYLIKVVPTEYEFINGTVLLTYQFSVTSFYQSQLGETNMPGVFFLYEPSAIKLHLTERYRHRSAVHFLLQIVTIVGGVFTVASILDAALHPLLRRYRSYGG